MAPKRFITWTLISNKLRRWSWPKCSDYGSSRVYKVGTGRSISAAEWSFDDVDVNDIFDNDCYDNDELFTSHVFKAFYVL